MNGRLYDATLARFISADPHIQAGSLSQSYNRYSYVMNNPMKYTDPTGYFFKKLKRAFKKIRKAVKKAWDKVRPYVGAIAGVAVALWCGVCGANLINASLAGAVVGAAGAAAVGGDILEGALQGAFTAGAAKWIGGANSIFGGKHAWDVGRSLAHGLVGGTANVIRGGKFGVGFMSSAFTKFVSDPIQGLAEGFAKGSETLGIAYGVTGAALVGGTASEIGGGKFANGAQTAAIQYTFNQIGDELSKPPRQRELESLTIDGHEIDVVGGANGGGISARNPANSVKLNKELASKQQLGESGVPIAGSGSNVPLRDVNRLTTQYGGQTSDWSKMSSSQHISPDGRKFETHWYQKSNGQRFEQKTIISDYLRGPR